MLRFVDSFDHYPNAEFLRKWSASRNATPQGIVAGGRFGNGWSQSERWSRKDFPSGQGTWIAGLAAKFGTTAAVNAIMGFWDNGTCQVDVRYNGTTKELYVTRNGTLLGSTYSFSPFAAQWYYIELKVVISDTVGVAVVRVDGQTVINLSNQDTKFTANATANMFRLGSFDDNVDSLRVYDDLYVCDGQVGAGSNPCNDFLGDIRVEALYPNGNGNSSQLTGSDGNSVDNYLLVDETDADDDTTYVESLTVGNKDTYAYTDLSSAGGTVYGVQILPSMRKTDAGARTAKTVARSGVTEVDGPAQILGTSYVYMPDIREIKPGGGDWAVADVNAAEFGIKVDT